MTFGTLALFWIFKKKLEAGPKKKSRGNLLKTQESAKLAIFLPIFFSKFSSFNSSAKISLTPQKKKRRTTVPKSDPFKNIRQTYRGYTEQPLVRTSKE